LKVLVYVLLATTFVGSAGSRPLEGRAAAPVPRLYWGAWIGNHLTGREAPWDMNAAGRFERGVGKRMSLIQFASPFANCAASPCTSYPFPTAQMDKIRAHGAIPFLSWGSAGIPLSASEPAFRLERVVAGVFDQYITGFAKAAAAWRHPFFIRFNWEMNGTWFPWAETANGNHPGDFVAAWRHVHDIFRAAGASSVTWVWCPNIGYAQNLDDLYPGDHYVDWTCLDGYNSGKPWRSFRALFRPSYKLLTGTFGRSKPLIVGETGSTEVGGNKAAWIRGALSAAATAFPRLKGILYFDKYDTMDWPIETSRAAQSAFARGVAAPTYAANRFATLGPGLIQPLPGSSRQRG
jgi:mannan endo-1,4-beta-mannosidase